MLVAEVRLGEEAEEEYVQALAWYEARSPKAADRFESAFAETLALIAESAEIFPPCDEEGFRYASVHHYPYRLIFRTLLDNVQVVAVAHARRKPGYWSRRV